MEVYNEDTRGQLRRTRLGHDHVSLTPVSRMSVKLAAQVSIVYIYTIPVDTVILMLC